MKYIFILSIFFLAACNQAREQVDQQAVRKEMEQREIKRVLPGEIMDAAYRQGDTIATMTQQQLLDQYQHADSTSGLAEFFRIQVSNYTDVLTKKYQADIRWISPEDTTNQQLSSWEKQILSAYIYNVAQHLEVSHNVQHLADENYLYTKPVFLDDTLKKELEEQQLTSDSAQFLGMWSIKLSKKVIIQNM